MTTDLVTEVSEAWRAVRAFDRLVLAEREGKVLAGKHVAALQEQHGHLLSAAKAIGAAIEHSTKLLNAAGAAPPLAPEKKSRTLTEELRTVRALRRSL